MLRQSLTFDHFLVRKVKRKKVDSSETSSFENLTFNRKERKKILYRVAYHFFLRNSIFNSETDAVIKKLSALAFFRRNGMRTQAIAASHKMSQTNSKDFCFVHCDVMLPWKWLLWMHVARAQCTALIEASWNNLNFSITVEIEVAKWGKQFHLGNKMFASLHFLTRAPVCLPMAFKSIHNDLANCSFLVFFLFI